MYKTECTRLNVQARRLAQDKNEKIAQDKNEKLAQDKSLHKTRIKRFHKNKKLKNEYSYHGS